MNVRDLVVVVIAMIGAVWIVRPAHPMRRWLFLVAVLFMAGGQAWIVGPHWQMLPAFGALTIATVMLFRMGEMPFTRGRAAWMVVAMGLALSSLALMWVLPVFALPEPTGDFYVGTRTLDAKDGQREMVAQVWYPVDSRPAGRARYVRIREVKPQFGYWWGVRTNAEQDAEVAGGAHPVVVFGPMWGGRRTQDTFLAEELASHGYVVVAVDHPGNAGRVEMADGTVVKSTMAGALSDVEASGAATIEGLWAKELAVWVRDDEFVLDQMARAEWLRGKVDMTRIGALGHSFGGAASMALLGTDKRVKCAVNLDGWTFNGLATRKTEPVLFVYEGSGEVRGRNTGAEAQLDDADNAAVDGSLARFGGLRAYVAGTQHLDFTDQTLVSPLQRLTYTGPIKGERVRTILRGMIVGFFDQTLKGSGQVPGFAEVRMERHPPPPVLVQNLQK